MADRVRIPRPEWLKVRLVSGDDFKEVRNLVSDLSLHTVCQEARCPNIFECFSDRTATFLILGDVCTRRCGFCSVQKGEPLPPDPDEPANVARAVEKLGLDYAVITSVDRDDLPDGGSRQFAKTVSAIRRLVPGCRVELLVPDFNGSRELVRAVLDSRPEVFAHNIETVPRLYERVRTGASYEVSLDVLQQAAGYRDTEAPGMRIKSGIMAGLGETMDEILETMEDIGRTGCDILTIGQYLSPLKRSLPVERFYTPGEFEELRKAGMKMGFRHVESGPLVRSSYHAKKQADAS